jgi:hypothetical protein
MKLHGHEVECILLFFKKGKDFVASGCREKKITAAGAHLI